MKSSKTNASHSRKRIHRKYALDRSPFYRLERRQDLARLLRLKSHGLDKLLANRFNLYLIKDEEINGKRRILHVPVASMRRIHERMFDLLQRILLPEFIRSPRKKSTAWGNAALHSEAKALATFDIKGFYPSTTEEHIFRFFRYRMEMSDDCARILAMLSTYEGVLPLGSPSSPHLACLVHLDLFEEAYALAVEADNTLTVWVDDIALSGKTNRRDIIALIKRRAAAKGLEIHKYHRGGGKRGVELTGTFIRNRKLSVANSSHLKIHKLTEELRASSNPSERYRLLNRLSAMARYQKTVMKSVGGDFARLDGRLNYYRREMRHLSKLLSVTQPKKIEKLIETTTSDAPPFAV